MRAKRERASGILLLEEGGRTETREIFLMEDLDLYRRWDRERKECAVGGGGGGGYQREYIKGRRPDPESSEVAEIYENGLEGNKESGGIAISFCNSADSEAAHQHPES